MPDPAWTSWGPPGVPHVIGRYEEQGPGAMRVRLVEASCSVCGARLRTACTSNAPRSKILRFALGHMHPEADGRARGR